MARSAPRLVVDGARVTVRPRFGRDALLAVGLVAAGVVAVSTANLFFMVVGVMCAGFGAIGLVSFMIGRGSVTFDQAGDVVLVGRKRVNAVSAIEAIEATASRAMTLRGPVTSAQVIVDFGHRRLSIADRVDPDAATGLAMSLAAALDVTVHLSGLD